MLTELDCAKVSTFLFSAGHAQPRFMGKYVIYRDQTHGVMAEDKLIEAESILSHVRYLSHDNIDRMVKRLFRAQAGDDFIADPETITNNPATLLALAEDDVFERVDYFRKWADTFSQG